MRAHTYRVESRAATWLAITTNGEFERIVRALARPEPMGVQQDELIRAAADSGIALVGPPLT